MTKQEAFELIVNPYKELISVLQKFPSHHDFVTGGNFLRTGILLIKEGIECSNFDQFTLNNDQNEPKEGQNDGESCEK